MLWFLNIVLFASNILVASNIPKGKDNAAIDNSSPKSSNQSVKDVDWVGELLRKHNIKQCYVHLERLTKTSIKQKKNTTQQNKCSKEMN